MKTIAIQIGNTDNKLSQQRWSLFVKDLLFAAGSLPAVQIHFSGGSDSAAAWQNFCVVFTAESMDGLLTDLATLCSRYGQDSIALTIGDTSMVSAKGLGYGIA